jgi:hypothetical protein
MLASSAVSMAASSAVKIIENNILSHLHMNDVRLLEANSL